MLRGSWCVGGPGQEGRGTGLSNGDQVDDQSLEKWSAGHRLLMQGGLPFCPFVLEAEKRELVGTGPGHSVAFQEALVAVSVAFCRETELMGCKRIHRD